MSYTINHTELFSFGAGRVKAKKFLGFLLMMFSWKIFTQGMCHFIVVRLFILLMSNLHSAAAPDIDETDIGNRDRRLKKTYEGLPKLRCI